LGSFLGGNQGKQFIEKTMLIGKVSCSKNLVSKNKVAYGRYMPKFFFNYISEIKDLDSGHAPIPVMR